MLELGTGQTLLEGLSKRVGPLPGWLFLAYLVGISANGVACSGFSSLLGVWQPAPELFADIWRLFIIRKTDSSELIIGVD